MAPSPPRPPEREADPIRVQALLDALPSTLQPLDASGLDGFLCGVLVHSPPLATRHWWPYVLDIDARPAPVGLVVGELRALVMQRHADLATAIAARAWFDPWIFEHEHEHEPEHEHEHEHEPDGALADDNGAAAIAASVRPWAFGFSVALESLSAPLLEQADGASLAMIYRHIGVEHMDDVDELRSRIESAGAVSDLDDAVEELVRATLLLADVAAGD